MSKYGTAIFSFFLLFCLHILLWWSDTSETLPHVALLVCIFSLFLYHFILILLCLVDICLLRCECFIGLVLNHNSVWDFTIHILRCTRCKRYIRGLNIARFVLSCIMASQQLKLFTLEYVLCQCLKQVLNFNSISAGDFRIEIKALKHCEALCFFLTYLSIL